MAAGVGVDKHVGQRIRARRREIGLSQMELAASMDVSFQQVQKYEVGANRASAARLLELGRVLDVPVSYFFEGLEADWERGGPDLVMALLSDADTTELRAAYRRISDQAARSAVLAAVRALADVANEAD